MCVIDVTFIEDTDDIFFIQDSKVFYLNDSVSKFTVDIIALNGKLKNAKVKKYKDRDGTNIDTQLKLVEINESKSAEGIKTPSGVISGTRNGIEPQDKKPSNTGITIVNIKTRLTKK